MAWVLGSIVFCGAFIYLGVVFPWPGIVYSFFEMFFSPCFVAPECYDQTIIMFIGPFNGRVRWFYADFCLTPLLSSFTAACPFLDCLLPSVGEGHGLAMFTTNEVQKYKTNKKPFFCVKNSYFPHSSQNIVAKFVNVLSSAWRNLLCSRCWSVQPRFSILFEAKKKLIQTKLLFRSLSTSQRVTLTLSPKRGVLISSDTRALVCRARCISRHQFWIKCLCLARLTSIRDKCQVSLGAFQRCDTFKSRFLKKCFSGCTWLFNSAFEFFGQ